MTNIFLAVLVITNVLLVSFIAVGLYKAYAAYRAIKSFITPVKEGEPSPLAQVTSATADMIARSLVAQAKATFMGIESGQKRAEKAVAGDIAMDVAAQHPLGALLTSFPSLAKSIRRNPQLIDLAMNYLAKKPGPGPAAMPTEPTNSNHSAQSAFKI